MLAVFDGTYKLLSDNKIEMKNNLFYTPVSVDVVLSLAGGPVWSAAQSVFGIISNQLAKEESNRRFEEINGSLRFVMNQLHRINLRMDRIDLALTLILDRTDEILKEIQVLPQRIAYYDVRGVVSHIQDHWERWAQL